MNKSHARDTRKHASTFAEPRGRSSGASGGYARTHRQYGAQNDAERVSWWRRLFGGGQRENHMAEVVIQAKRIELLDAQGHPSLILTGRDEVGRAGLVMSSFEETS